MIRTFLKRGVLVFFLVVSFVLGVLTKQISLQRKAGLRVSVASVLYESDRDDFTFENSLASSVEERFEHDVSLIFYDGEGRWRQLTIIDEKGWIQPRKKVFKYVRKELARER